MWVFPAVFDYFGELSAMLGQGIHDAAVVTFHTGVGVLSLLAPWTLYITLAICVLVMCWYLRTMVEAVRQNFWGKWWPWRKSHTGELPVARAKWHATAGCVGDTAEIFLVAEIDGKRVRIEIDESKGKGWQALLPKRLSPEVVQERAIPGSVQLPVAKYAKGVVELYQGNEDAKEHVGMGFRVLLPGKKDVLVTAFHNLSLTQQMWITANNKTHKLDPYWALEVMSKDLDVAAIVVPGSVWAYLGVAQMKLQRFTPNDGIVRATGPMESGQSTISQGKIEGRGPRLLSFRHSASTRPGWSGAPIISGKGMVIGVHTGYDLEGSGFNLATSLDFLSKPTGKESDYGAGSLWSASDEDDFQDEADIEEYRLISRGRKGKFKGASGYFGPTSWEDTAIRKWSDYPELYQDDVSEQDDDDYREEQEHNVLTSEPIVSCSMGQEKPKEGILRFRAHDGSWKTVKQKGKKVEKESAKTRVHLEEYFAALYPKYPDGQLQYNPTEWDEDQRDFYVDLSTHERELYAAYAHPQVFGGAPATSAAAQNANVQVATVANAEVQSAKVKVTQGANQKEAQESQSKNSKNSKGGGTTNGAKENTSSAVSSKSDGASKSQGQKRRENDARKMLRILEAEMAKWESGTGLTEERKQNLLPLFSKPDVTTRQSPRKTSQQ